MNKFRVKADLVEEETTAEQAEPSRRSSWTERRRSSLLGSLFAEEGPRRSSYPADVPPPPWALAPPFLTAPDYAKEDAGRRTPRGKGDRGKGGKRKEVELDESEEDEDKPAHAASKARYGRLADLLRDPVNFLRISSSPKRSSPLAPPSSRSNVLSRISTSSSVASSSSDDSSMRRRFCPPYQDECGIDPLDDCSPSRPATPGQRPSLLDRRRFRSTSSLGSCSSASSYLTASSRTSSELELTISNFLDRKSVFLALPPMPSSAPSTPTYAPTLETVWEANWPAGRNQRHSA